LISWPSFTLTSTTTPDMGAPTDPGSDVAFSRETVSTAEFLSSTETARTYGTGGTCQRNIRMSQLSRANLAVNFEPDVTLCTPLHNRSDGHQADNERLSFFDRNVHLLSSGWSPQEVPCGKDTTQGRIHFRMSHGIMRQLT
jgi:hypothetical protein